MSLVIRFSPPSLTAQQYDEVVRRLTEAGVFPADGLDYELCFGSEGNLKVGQVWDSQEQLEAFGERLRPVLAELGIDPGEPEVLEVHTITGAGDMLCRVVAQSNADLQRVIDAIVSAEGVVRSATLISLATQVSYRVLPLVRAATRWDRSD